MLMICRSWPTTKRSMPTTVNTASPAAAGEDWGGGLNASRGSITSTGRIRKVWFARLGHTSTHLSQKVVHCTQRAASASACSLVKLKSIRSKLCTQLDRQHPGLHLRRLARPHALDFDDLFGGEFRLFGRRLAERDAELPADRLGRTSAVATCGNDALRAGLGRVAARIDAGHAGAGRWHGRWRCRRRRTPSPRCRPGTRSRGSGPRPRSRCRTGYWNSLPEMATGLRRPSAPGSPNLLRRHSSAVTLPAASRTTRTGVVSSNRMLPSSNAPSSSSGLAGISARVRR